MEIPVHNHTPVPHSDGSMTCFQPGVESGLGAGGRGGPEKYKLLFQSSYGDAGSSTGDLVDTDWKNSVWGRGHWKHRGPLSAGHDRLTPMLQSATDTE